MKLVVNAFSARLGGGQTYLLNLLEYIPKRDDLDVLVFAPPDLVLPNNPHLRRMDSRWPISNPLLRALWEKFVLPRVLRNEHADILFCPGGTINTNLPKNCKAVTMFRNMIPFDPRVRKRLPIGLQKVRNWLLERIIVKSMASSDLTIFISDYARRVMEHRINVRKSVTIPHGINPIFKTAGKHLARSPVAPVGEYILYVSKFDVYKHHYEVVTAYNKLSIELRKRYKLVFAGESIGEEANRVIAIIKKLGLQDNISILGSIPYHDLPSLYHHANLIVFASSCENCPNILLEALGAGRPILCSNVMPMPEFGGEYVGYFSPFDPKDIARKITEVLTNPELAKELAQSAAIRSEKYNLSQSAERTWIHLLSLAETDLKK